MSVILIIVAIITTISIWALSGQSNLSNNANNNIDVQASALIDDGVALKSMFNQYQIQGMPQLNIVYMPGLSNTETQSNLLDPTVELSVKTPNAQIIRSNPAATDSYWAYLKYAATTLGLSIDPNDYERMIVVGGIKDNVCKRINYILNGSETILNFGQRDSSLISAVTKAVPYTNIAVYFPPVPGVQMGTSGCGSSAYPDDNLYHIVLQVN